MVLTAEPESVDVVNVTHAICHDNLVPRVLSLLDVTISQPRSQGLSSYRPLERNTYSSLN